MALFVLHWGFLVPIFILSPAAFIISEWMIPSPNTFHLILRIIVTLLLGLMSFGFSWMAVHSAVPTWRYAIFSLMEKNKQDREERAQKRFDRACKKTWDRL